MPEQLLIGSGVILLSIVIETLFIAAASRAISRYRRWLARPPYLQKDIITIVLLTSWLLVALFIAIWLWALLFVLLGLFDRLEPAMYFAIVSFTTLGLGDIVIQGPWRLMSGIAAANGLILFALATAYLLEAMRRLHELQESGSEDRI